MFSGFDKDQVAETETQAILWKDAQMGKVNTCDKQPSQRNGGDRESRLSLEGGLYKCVMEGQTFIFKTKMVEYFARNIRDSQSLLQECMKNIRQFNIMFATYFFSW